MSHLPERKEKICLNCKTVIYGRFCHVCGQENTEPKETFWGLITHFVYDLTHFDGKFFDTTKYLLFRPGYLANEYLRGRRASYLNPIRMYIFTSAFFFIIFFTFISTSPSERFDEAENELKEGKEKLVRALRKEGDAAKRAKLESEIKDADSILAIMYQTGIAPRKPGDAVSFSGGIDTGAVFKLKDLPNTVKEYDSIQKILPSTNRDGWIEQYFKRKVISINMRYKGDRKEFFDNISYKFKHSIPQMMFVSLPLVALILQALYFRKRRHYYYVNHVIFCVYVYIAVYLLLLVYYLLGWLYNITELNFFYILVVAMIFLITYYIYKSMRNFYGQRRAKTVLKFFLLMFSITFLFFILILVFGINSMLQM